MVLHNLYIKDTGYLQTDLSGTPYTTELSATTTEKDDGEYKVNDGTAILLKGISFSYDISQDVDKTPSASGKTAYLRLNSCNLPTLTVSGYFNLSEYDEQLRMRNIIKMSKSKGHKDLYFDTSALNQNNILTFIAVDLKNTAADAVTNYVHLNGIVTGFRLDNTTETTIVRYNITFDITEQ